jgi:hypothetical protein
MGNARVTMASYYMDGIGLIYFLPLPLAAFLAGDAAAPPFDLYDAISFSYRFLSSAAAFSHLDLSLTVAPPLLQPW